MLIADPVLVAEYGGQVNKGVPLVGAAVMATVGARDGPLGTGVGTNVGVVGIDVANTVGVIELAGLCVGADTATYVTVDDPITLTVPVQLPLP